MSLIIEIIVLCSLFFFICFIKTGTDDKNIKSFKTYPKGLQDKLKQDDDFKGKIYESSEIVIFFSNLLIFLILLFTFGLFVKTTNFLYNFVFLLILGEVLNIFDFVVIDMLYFIHSNRTRFSKYQDKEDYKGIKNHFISFIKGIFMFAIVALIDGFILTLF